MTTPIEDRAAASHQAVIYSEGTHEWNLLNKPLSAPTLRVRRANAHHPTVAQRWKDAIGSAGKRVPNVDLSSSFRYSRLGEGEIRILRLYPSRSTSDPLKADLFSRKLEDKDVKGRYEALSYCWGTGTATHDIQIRDLNATSPKVRGGRGRLVQLDRSSKDTWLQTIGAITHTDFPIRKNLHDALKRLRSKYSDTYLWVDAICIDQTKAGEEEKQSQLAMMSRIYNYALRVCVWLGEDGGGAESAFKLVADIMNYKNFSAIFHGSENTVAWGNLTRIMGLEWFSRRWVIQEIALSRDASIHCGEYTAHWDDFAEAVSLLVENAESMRTEIRDEALDDIETSSASILIQTLGNICRKSDYEEDRGAISSRLLNVETLVSTLLSFQATFPPDIIYSILSLAKDSPQPDEDWQSLHIEQLIIVKDHKLKRIEEARHQLYIQKTGLENRLKARRLLFDQVEAQNLALDELGKQSDEAKTRKREAEAQELDRRILKIYEDGITKGELEILSNTLHRLRDGVDQLRVQINQLDLKHELTKHEVQTHPITLLPDYKISTRDLFIAFVTRSINQSGSLDIICRHWAPELPDDASSSQMPSWISRHSRSPFGLAGTARGRQNGDNLVAYLPHDQRRRYSASGATEAIIEMLPDPQLTMVKVPLPVPHSRPSSPIPEVPGISSASQNGTRPAKSAFKAKEIDALSMSRTLDESATADQLLAGRKDYPASLLADQSSFGDKRSKSKRSLFESVTGRAGRALHWSRKTPDQEGLGLERMAMADGGDVLAASVEAQNHQRDGSTDTKEGLPAATASELESDDKYKPLPADRKFVAPHGRLERAPTVGANFPSASSWTPGPHRLSGILVVKGFVLGVIKSHSDVMRGGVIPGEWVSRLGWKRGKESENQVPDTLWRLLVADRMANGAWPPLWYKRACLHGLVDDKVSDNAGNIHTVTPFDRKISELTTMYFKRVESIVWNRRILEIGSESMGGGSSDAGSAEHRLDGFEDESSGGVRVLYGLGPEGSARGDIICILYGCSVPVVLRAARNQRVEDLYELVGEAYVQGVMDGEFMIKDWTERARNFHIG